MVSAMINQQGRKEMFGGLRKLTGPKFAHRMFFTADARLNAFENAQLVPTGLEGSTGQAPMMQLTAYIRPTDFDYHVTPPQIANPAPVGANNPLLTPALALSFAQNLVGHSAEDMLPPQGLLQAD